MLGTRTYKITDAAGVLAHRAVVRGTNDGECKKPTAANVGKFVGITAEAQATQNKPVPVDVDGVVFGVASGAISYGDMVNIADTGGKLASVEATVALGLVNPAAVQYVVGFAETAAAADGDLFKVRICPMVIPLAVS